MKNLLPIMVSLLFMAGGCNKGTTPAPSPTPSTANFQPTKTGSTWSYRKTNLLTSVITNYTATASAKDSTINSRLYRVFTRTSGANEYYSLNGNDYYQYGTMDAFNQVMEWLYMRSGLTTGATWEETKPITSGSATINMKFVCTLVEKDINYTVGSTTYSKVSHINLVLSSFGLPITTQSLDFYYADGIGRIFSKTKLVIPLAGINTDTETALTAYTLVP